MEKKLIVLLSAGGTGGHIIPACQLAKNLLKREKVKKVVFAAKGLKNNRSFQDSFPYKEIAAASLKNKMRFFFAFLKGFFQGLFFILKLNPSVVVGFGSFHSFPILAAAKILNKKIVLFEPNTSLGKVNRFFAPLVKTVAIQFPLEDKINNAKFIHPLSWPETPILDKKTARKKLNVKEDVLLALVFGGSQGASFINSLCFEAFSKLLLPIQVINITGSDEETAIWSEKYKKNNITAIVKTFERGLDNFYAAADFAVCRCGAATSAELIFFNMPSIVIPYPYATENHQEKNGYFLEKEVRGSFVVLQNVAYDVFMNKLLQLMENLPKYRENIIRYKNNKKKEEDFADLIIKEGEKK